MAENNKINDNKKSSVLKKLQKNNEQITGELDGLLKATKGYGLVTKDNIIDPDITDIVTNRNSMGDSSSMSDDLFSAKGTDKFSGFNISDIVYSDLKSRDTKDLMIEDLIKPRIVKNLEYNYILNNMVEMTNSLDTLSEDVVFPNVSLESGIELTFVGNNAELAGERGSDLIKYFRPNEDILASIRSKRLFNFDIDEVVKELVFNLATYGYQIAYTMPYKAIINDLLYNNLNSNNPSNMYTSKGFLNNTAGKSESIEDVTAFAESFYDKFDNIVSDNNMRIAKEDFEITKYAKEHNFKINIGEEADKLNEIFTSKPYSFQEVDYVVNMIKEDANLFVEDNIVAAGEDTENNGANMYDILKGIKEKKQKKFVIDNVKGCTFEFLDINKVQPIFIKDELLGVYVVESIPEAQKYKLGNSLTNIINSSQIDDGLNLGDNYRNQIRDILFKDVEAVLRRNISKSFLRNNPNLIEDIEWLLNTNGIHDITQNKIRFIPSEYLTFFKHGPGLLGQSMLNKTKVYALMHIQLNKAEALNKVFLNKERYKVSVNDTGNVDSKEVVNKAVSAVRNAIPRLTDIGIPDTMTDSILANYQTVIVQKDGEGNESFDVSSMGLNEPRDNSEYLRYLRNQATMALGYPSDMLDPSQNIDFAKKISHINLRTQSKIINMQKTLELPLSELCTKRLQFMTGLEGIEVKVSFARPKPLSDTTSVESLDLVQRKVEMYEVLIENNTEIKDNEKAIMKAKLAKKLLSEFLDMDVLDETLHNTIVEGTEI